MANSQDSSKVGLTRGKAILIAVLGIVLVVILYMQFRRREQVASGQPAGYRPPRRLGAKPPVAVEIKAANVAAALPSGAPQTTPVLTIDESRWKAPDLTKVTAYDPFKLPDAFPQPARAVVKGSAPNKADLAAAAEAEDLKKRAEALSKLHTQLKDLKQRGVTVIVRERDQYAAMIDDRILHVGDKIDGFTVIAIDDRDGVVIERKDSP